MSDNPTLATDWFASRFRNYLPVVIDVETAGFNPKTDALLEVAAVFLEVDQQGVFSPGEVHAFHIEPFKGANLDPKSIEFLGIDPFHPFRFAKPETVVMEELYEIIQHEIDARHCQKAFLVGHNSAFDLSFIKAYENRNHIKQSVFHSFTSIDTASLSLLFYGQTVLAKAMEAAKIEFNADEAHSAKYDAIKTCELFCDMLNRWQQASTNPFNPIPKEAL